MSRGPKAKTIPVAAPAPPIEGGKPIDLAAAGVPPRPEVTEKKRRRRGIAAFEERIGYRFKNAAVLEQALTHISALAGARNRAGSYQRLEFLGDHV
ncbi:MAG: ribonuclease III, partial [Pseudolabrys sp.]